MWVTSGREGNRHLSETAVSLPYSVLLTKCHLPKTAVGVTFRKAMDVFTQLPQTPVLSRGQVPPWFLVYPQGSQPRGRSLCWRQSHSPGGSRSIHTFSVHSSQKHRPILVASGRLSPSWRESCSAWTDMATCTWSMFNTD